MRLLYFSRDYTPHDHRFLSGLAEQARLQYLGKSGFQPRLEKIFYLRLERRNPQTEDRPLPPEVEQIPWSGGREPLNLKGLKGWFRWFRLFRDLQHVIKDVKPDLIQAGPLQRSAFMVALAGFPHLISMSWGYDLLIDAQRSPIWRWATRYTLRRSAAMIGDCDTIRRLAVSYGISNDRVVTFPWGVDIHHFQPLPASQKPELDGDSFTLLSTRSWEPVYGVDLIARAFVKAAQWYPGLQLIMLGGGSLAGELRRIFAQGRVDDRVVFPGQISFADLPRYYQMADLYISASHSDGSSISLLEAMACGCPVLVADIPGNREWVSSGENGWLFPDGHVDALAQAILHAVENRQQLPEMGRKSRQIAEARADWEKNFPQLFFAYQIALNGISSPDLMREKDGGKQV